MCVTLLSHIIIVVPNHPPSVGCQEDVIILRAVMMAGAGLDEHHLLCEDVSLWTLELHLDCDGGVRRAAAIVHADTAELWSVQPGAHAARQLKVHPLLGLCCPDTFLPLLDFFFLMAVAGPYHTDPSLPLQLAALVVIGYTG